MKRSSRIIKVAARSSKLSRAQVDEVLSELRQVHPNVSFDPIWAETAGDIDQKTSLRFLEKTDFFTKEVDQLVLEQKVKIAIHSAKDLPNVIPNSLRIAAITKGLDPRDCLVMRPGFTMESLSEGATIATSSLRREEMVKKLRNDFTFIDLRGTLEQRLDLLAKGMADGVVVALAALIRLQLDFMNFQILPGMTVEGQGRLAIICRDTDQEMIELFRPCAFYT